MKQLDRNPAAVVGWLAANAQWLVENDLRFVQFLSNALAWGDRGDGFYLENDDLVRLLQEYKNHFA